jgi:hypothetical protein
MGSVFLNHIGSTSQIISAGSDYQSDRATKHLDYPPCHFVPLVKGMILLSNHRSISCLYTA